MSTAWATDACPSISRPTAGEEIAGAVPGKHKGRFDIPSLPPTAALLPTITMLETARDLGRPAMEEVALEFATAILKLASGATEWGELIEQSTSAACPTPSIASNSRLTSWRKGDYHSARSPRKWI